MGGRKYERKKIGVFSCLDRKENKEEKKKSVDPTQKSFLSSNGEKMRERRFMV